VCLESTSLDLGGFPSQNFHFHKPQNEDLASAKSPPLIFFLIYNDYRPPPPTFNYRPITWSPSTSDVAWPIGFLLLVPKPISLPLFTPYRICPPFFFFFTTNLSPLITSRSHAYYFSPPPEPARSKTFFPPASMGTILSFLLRGFFALSQLVHLQSGS